MTLPSRLFPWRQTGECSVKADPLDDIHTDFSATVSRNPDGSYGWEISQAGMPVASGSAIDAQEASVQCEFRWEAMLNGGSLG